MKNNVQMHTRRKMLYNHETYFKQFNLFLLKNINE